MKVYILTAGVYSDYHIVGVTTDRRKAEEYKEMVKGDWSGVDYIEEYDTDVFDAIPKDCRIYCASKFKKENDLYIYLAENTENAEIKKPRIEKTCYGKKEFRVYFYARDKEHAAKVASEIYAEYIWNNPMAWEQF